MTLFTRDDLVGDCVISSWSSTLRARPSDSAWLVAGRSRYGTSIAAQTIYDSDGVVIQVASAEALLVMKLRANRSGRDTDDIRQLLALCDITAVEDADALYEAFYPGDSLPERAWKMVTTILKDGPLPKPDPLGPIAF